jgi:short-subunit dehydrogenase
MAIKDTTILITGASRGIGKALALKLAEHGARLALTGRDAKTLQATCGQIEAGGGSAREYVADAVDGGRAREVVEAVTKDMGPIDTLVNNAGLVGEVGPFWETDLSVCWRTVEVNLLGPMAYTHAAAPAMVARKSGCIINMGSYAGIRALPANVSYATSKAALVRFSDSIAESVRNHGIHVFTVSPGMVDTDMTRSIDIKRLLPGVEFTDKSKIGRLVVNLLTKDVGRLTGRFIHANDDLDELIQNADRIAKEDSYTLRLPKLDGLA